MTARVLVFLLVLRRPRPRAEAVHRFPLCLPLCWRRLYPQMSAPPLQQAARRRVRESSCSAVNVITGTHRLRYNVLDCQSRDNPVPFDAHNSLPLPRFRIKRILLGLLANPKRLQTA